MSFKRTLALILALTMCLTLTLPGVAFAAEPGELDGEVSGETGGVVVGEIGDTLTLQDQENAIQNIVGQYESVTEAEPAKLTKGNDSNVDPMDYITFVYPEGYDDSLLSKTGSEIAAISYTYLGVASTKTYTNVALDTDETVQANILASNAWTTTKTLSLSDYVTTMEESVTVTITDVSLSAPTLSAIKLTTGSKISPDIDSIDVTGPSDESTKINAWTVMSDGSVAELKYNDATWSMADTSIATVTIGGPSTTNKAGLFAVSTGSTTLTVSYQGVSKTLTVNSTVTLPPASVEITGNTSVELGKSTQLSVAFKDANGDPLDPNDPSGYWTSSDETVIAGLGANVLNSSFVSQALTTGTTTITFTYGGDPTITASVEVTVARYVAQIDETKYETLAAAVEAAGETDVITLLADIDIAEEDLTSWYTMVSSYIEVVENAPASTDHLTIALNGHQLYSADQTDGNIPVCTKLWYAGAAQTKSGSGRTPKPENKSVYAYITGETTYTLHIIGSGEAPGFAASADQCWRAYDAQIIRAEVNNSISWLGAHMLDNMQALQTISLPASLLAMEGNAIYEGLVALTSIEVSAENTAYKSDAGVLYSKDGTKLVHYPASKLGTVFNIPAGVIHLGHFRDTVYLEELYGTTPIESFNRFDNSSLVKVELPLAENATITKSFQNCNALTTVTFTGGCFATIGEKAFYNNPNLSTVIIPISENATLGNNAFASCAALSSVMFTGGNFKTVSTAFDGNTSLTTLTIPIAESATFSSSFRNLTNLSSLTFTGGTIASATSWIQGCPNLTELVIPVDATATIGAWACSVSKLTVVGGSESLTIDANAFKGDNAPNLTTLDLSAARIKQINGNAFASCKATTIILGNMTSCTSVRNDSKAAFSNLDENAKIIAFYDVAAPAHTAVNSLYKYAATSDKCVEIVLDGMDQTSVLDANLALATPTKPGFTFEGWYLTADFSGDPVAVGTAPAVGNTYYAKWQISPYAYSELAVDENGLPTKVPEEAAAAGKTLFTGWYTDTSYTTPCDETNREQGFALFLDPNVLYVGVQIRHPGKVEGTSDIRLITSVPEEGNYDKVGFELWRISRTDGHRLTQLVDKTVGAQYIYDVVYGLEGGVVEVFTPDFFSEDSAKVTALSVTSFADTYFQAASCYEVVPYLMTKDGVKSYGASYQFNLTPDYGVQFITADHQFPIPVPTT